MAQPIGLRLTQMLLHRRNPILAAEMNISRLAPHGAENTSVVAYLRQIGQLDAAAMGRQTADHPAGELLLAGGETQPGIGNPHRLPQDRVAGQRRLGLAQ